MCGSDRLSSSSSLLICGNHAAVRQKIHLTPCPVLRGQLCETIRNHLPSRPGLRCERISVKSRFLPFTISLARYGSLWHASARRPLLEQEDARSCLLRDPAIPDAQSGFRLRSSINESTRGKPGESRQSNIGRACEHCVMLANASIQNTTTLQGLPFRRSRRLPGSRRRFVVPTAGFPFREDDTCWLGALRCSSCSAAPP